MTLDTRARRAAQGINRAVEVMEMTTFNKEPRKVERFDRFRDRKQRNRRMGAIVLGTTIVITAIVLVSTIAVDRGQGTVPADRGENPEPPPLVEPVSIGTVTSSGGGCALEIDAETIPAGAARLTVVNETDRPVSFDLFRWGTSFAQLEAFVASGKLYPVHGGPFTFTDLPTGALVVLVQREVRPGASGTITYNFTTGNAFAVVCAHPRAGFDIFRDWNRPFALVGPIVVR